MTDAQIARLQARVAELEAELAAERRARRAAEQRATRDPLTGLLNRYGLADDWANRRPRPGQRLALIDLDGFKPVNDQHGHAAGDEVLRAVAYWLRDLPVAARLGGDEFVALVDGAGQIPTRVGARLPDGTAVSVGLSVGLAPARGELGEVLARADAAMYAAKARGGGCEEWNPYAHDRPVVPRPRVRLRDDRPVVVDDAVRVT